jgi:Ca2+-binding EF-hand superfamily protein
MTNLIRNMLLAGAALAIGAGVALAQVDTPAPTNMAGTKIRPQGSFADRFMAEFDLNHDGKVTRDEFNKVVAQHFKEASGGKPTMTVEQFTNAHMKDFRKYAGQMFHRIDWNGDGRLSLEEFAAPIRARFEAMDRDGTGTVHCFGGYPDDAAARATKEQTHTFARRRAGGFRGRGGLCEQYNAGHEGVLTRAALDKAIAAQFSSASKGGSMSFDQFYGLALQRYRAINARIFNRIDRDHSGALTEAEYAGSEMRFFKRLDRNNDGVITQDELSFHRKAGWNNHGQGRKKTSG